MPDATTIEISPEIEAEIPWIWLYRLAAHSSCAICGCIAGWNGRAALDTFEGTNHRTLVVLCEECASLRLDANHDELRNRWLAYRKSLPNQLAN